MDYNTILLGKRDFDFTSCLNQAEKKTEEKWNTVSLDICKEELEEYYLTLKKYIGVCRG